MSGSPARYVTFRTSPMKTVWSPASRHCSTVHSKVASADLSSGTERGSRLHPSSSNRSPQRENRIETSRWLLASTLIPKAELFRNAGSAEQRWSIQTSTMGGTAETDVKEFTVRPRGRPSESNTAATQTPVAKRAQARRSSAASSTGASAGSGVGAGILNTIMDANPGTRLDNAISLFLS